MKTQKIKLNVLPVYDDKHIKTKLRTYGDKVYTIFHGLIMMIITNIKLGNNDDELEIKQRKRKN